MARHRGCMDGREPSLFGVVLAQDLNNSTYTSNWEVFKTFSLCEQGPDFWKFLKHSYDNLRIFTQYTLILRQIYDITAIVQTL